MKVHFPNLNSIRFIAALLVIVHHIEQYKSVFSLPNNWNNHSIDIIGKLGVILFFVLSGFLITYLLLAEQKTTSTVDIKSFYIRRILRIWPLYYLIVFLAFLIFPNIGFMYIPGHEQTHWLIKAVFFIFFMPNVIHALGAGVAYANQAWSIGAEEQFYLIWPILMKYVKNKILLLLSVILIYIGLKFLFFSYSDKKIFGALFKIWNLFCIDCMAIGGVFAVIAFNKYKRFVDFLQNKAVQILAWGITIFLIVIGKKFVFFHYEIYALLFGIIIFNLAVNPNSIVQFKINAIDYLGKISYGLYMYQTIGIVLSIKFVIWLNLVNNLIIYPLSILTTITLAYLSYNYFEKRYIRLKVKFSKIISGDNAVEKEG